MGDERQIIEVANAMDNDSKAVGNAENRQALEIAASVCTCLAVISQQLTEIKELLEKTRGSFGCE